MKKSLLVLPGYCVGLGGLLLITYRTLLAAGAESKSITVQVNRFGEQYIDLACLVLLWGVCMVGLYSLLSLQKKETNGKEHNPEGTKGAAQKKLGNFSRQVLDVLHHDSSVINIGTIGEPSHESSSGYFLLDSQGTATTYCVSVKVLRDTREE
jgi:hypothetical protein